MSAPRSMMPWLALPLVLALAGCGGQGGRSDAGEAVHSREPRAQNGTESDEHGHGAEGSAADAAGQSHESAEEHASEGGVREGWVRLDREQREAAGVVLGAPAPREIAIVRELPGEIAVNADRLAHIVPRFSGIAREVEKNLGEPVVAGEVLAVVEANESLALYEVKSLIAGTVIEKHITLGEFVSDEQDIYVVADLASVWVHLTVYARDLERIRVGQNATIEAAGISERAAGKIDYVGPVVGEATRTSLARIVLANPKRTWRPGLFVTARVRTEAAPAGLALPDRAVQTVRGERVVFVEDGEGFRAQEVEIGRTDGEWTEILSGLAAGDRVVVDGGFILKSELLKSEAGHGHGH